jgi:hypothetical protein
MAGRPVTFPRVTPVARQPGSETRDGDARPATTAPAAPAQAQVGRPSPAGMSSGVATAALGLFLALFGLYAYTSPGRIDIIDGQYRYEVTRNWLDLGRPVIRDRALAPLDLAVQATGVYAFYNAPASVTPMPLVLLARSLPVNTSERERFFFSMTGPLFGAALGALLLVAYSMLGLSLASAVGWASVCCIATQWWPASTTVFDQNQHALWLMLALVLAWQSGRRGRVGLAALGGLAGAALVAYQENYALLLPLVALAVSSPASAAPPVAEAQSPRASVTAFVWRYVTFGLTNALGLLALIGFNLWRFGAPFYPGRFDDPRIFGAGSPLASLVGLFVSPGKSLFLFSPPMILAVLGARALFVRAPTLALAIAAVSVAHVLIIMQLVLFAGDWAWGPRLLLILIPMWALAFPFAPVRARPLIAGVAAAGVIVQLLAVSVDHQRFFFERNLGPHFWAADPWFYLRNSQLFARPGELTSMLREGVPAEVTSFSPTPWREVTYSPFGPGRPAQSDRWVRHFRVFYLPRPWPFWIFDVGPARRPVEPWPWLLLSGGAMIMGVALTWAALRSPARGRWP